MAKMNMVQALNLALRQEMERDETVLILGEDVGVDGGVFRVTDGLQELFGEKRVMDTPLAESGILGSSIGMALGGLRPVAEMQFSGFSHLMDAQLEGHASRYRSRSQGRFTVPLVVRMPYGGGVRALEHHSESRESLYAHMPGVKMLIPSGPRNARALLAAAIRDPDPVVFFEPKRSYRAFKEEVPEEEELMEIGKAQIVVPGTELTLISWGAMFRVCQKAVEDLSARGRSIELIDLLSISPMDAETITASVARTGRCVIVQEAPRTLGPASEIIAHVNDRCLDRLEAPIQRVSGYDVVTPYFGREDLFMPNPTRIVHAVEDTLAWT